MRSIEVDEQKQHGCIYCADMVSNTEHIDNHKASRRKCPHEECPYSELDLFQSYDAYVKATQNANISQILGLVGRKTESCD